MHPRWLDIRCTGLAKARYSCAALRRVALAPDPPNNLPAQFTSFIGRKREVSQVLELVRRPDVRLVTLTGPGGVGKTRLAIDVASRLADDFEDGVFFVSLAPKTDAALVTSTIADVLDVQEVSGVPLLRTLQAYLRDRTLLLLLDNFEHVMAAASTVADLLIVSPRLQVLATSRAPLHLRGEHELDVPPLPLPQPDTAPEPVDLRGAEAVRLFEERARAIKADFAVTRDNAAWVAEICRRLDGLPLALELAAARIKVLPPAALLAHLDRRLTLLTSGALDVPARQRALRATIAGAISCSNRPNSGYSAA
jgi:predicted ATPase